ncbi:MAG TPA: DUF2851 family protein [Proteiniphilum sp.]|nr:DUF2851 family protein [Proteiniphilum sp.]HPJ49887.1 DUF2851 family protein [Proteiniphilum sp.]HPR19315.1 DUF2851 family protein [Proteiniphilum sp.]
MNSQEQLLHYVWKYRLYPRDALVTTDGCRVEVIDPGEQNPHAGPDFFNAKVRIGEVMWAGNVEIHDSSADWYLHGHHLDPVYNSVVLHLSGRVNREVVNQKGESVPQTVLPLTEKVRNNADYLLHSDHPLPCRDFIAGMDQRLVRSWLDDLSLERLERKCDEIYNHLNRFNHSWDEVFYVILTRNFGFGLNSPPFESLALSLPLNYILRHNDDLQMVEALLFGQAGLLEDSGVKDSYYRRLQSDYRFLSNKYGLRCLEGFLFSKMRIRPYSFPHVRIAQLASLLQHAGRLFSTVLETENPVRMTELFRYEPSEYWATHYTFGKESPKTNKSLGAASLEILLINTVAPILFTYGKQTDREQFCDRGFQLLHFLKPERNAIVETFRELGIQPANASDSQALIQLRKEYCDRKKCLYCRIGHSLLTAPGTGH